MLRMQYSHLDIIPNSKDAAEVARLANEEMAEIIAKHPHEFVAKELGHRCLRESIRSVEEMDIPDSDKKKYSRITLESSYV